MTKVELEQLRHLGDEINQINTKILELETIAEGTTSGGISDEPFSGNISDKVGNGASKLADYKARLKNNKDKYWAEINRIMTWIEEIPSSEMRQIMSLKYINNFTFQQIAFAIGHHDEQIPRKKHNKYLGLYEKYERNLI